jgi:hypothetical protein
MRAEQVLPGSQGGGDGGTGERDGPNNIYTYE